MLHFGQNSYNYFMNNFKLATHMKTPNIQYFKHSYRQKLAIANTLVLPFKIKKAVHKSFQFQNIVLFTINSCPLRMAFEKRHNRRALYFKSRPVFLYQFYVITGMNLDNLLSSPSFSAFVDKIDLEIPLLMCFCVANTCVQLA